MELGAHVDDMGINIQLAVSSHVLPFQILESLRYFAQSRRPSNHPNCLQEKGSLAASISGENNHHIHEARSPHFRCKENWRSLPTLCCCQLVLVQAVVQQAKAALGNTSLTGLPQMRSEFGSENLPPNPGFDMGQVRELQKQSSGLQRCG